MNTKIAILIAYLLIINLIAFVLYGLDKYKAKHGQWRISEKTLLLSAVIGGSIGATAGMFAFRHKTQHWYFRYGLPLILVLQAVIVWIVWLRIH